MHLFYVNCGTFSNEENAAAVVPVTSVVVTCSEAISALSFSSLLVKCWMKILRMSALGWQYICDGCLLESVPHTCCISLLDDVRAILSV